MFRGTRDSMACDKKDGMKSKGPADKKPDLKKGRSDIKVEVMK